jgi:hypothetical protein
VRSEREQNIDQVAGIIYDQCHSPEEARSINEAAGWGFDVNYDTRFYANPTTSWTRVEGVKLSAEDLGAAVDMVVEWRDDQAAYEVALGLPRD